MNLMARWKHWTGGATIHATPERLPLRGELFTAEHLQTHAKALAAGRRIETTPNPEPSRLLAQLDKNEALLRRYNLSTMHAGGKRAVTPAAEWLLDNSYLLNEQILLARRHLPRRYSRQLPRLASGPCAGLPRVYDLALELISHTHGRCAIENVSAFVAAYQSVQELTLGELWAVPIMLRLALIENVSRIAEGLLQARQHRDLADEWAERMAETTERAPSDLIIIVSELARSKPPLSHSFVAELSRRLQVLGVPMQLVRHWLDQRLAEDGQNCEEIIYAENQMQAADQVSVSNSITSLRAVGAADWREFVESLSTVEQALRRDPDGIYGEMDFASRDRYRHAVEEIARFGRMNESQVALAAVELARAAPEKPAEGAASASDEAPRQRHVGFYLIDAGMEQLRRRAEARLPLVLRFRQTLRNRPLASYLSAIILLTILLAAGALFAAVASGVTIWRLALWAVIPLVCFSQLAVSLVNWLVALVLEPRLLPRLDFSEGIPPSSRTVAVSPMMLSGAAAIDAMLERLELLYLSNRDRNLRFALLTDFMDASQASELGDEALLRRIRAGVERLNDRYKTDRPSIFFLFHRPRLWNEKEGVWMGWERKRGKLTDFNAVLQGGPVDHFTDIVGDFSLLRGAKYVITLDSDTQLPRDAARQLIGAIAHPLNRPRFDPQKRRITDGYAILQPRVAVSLPSAGRSWFVRLFAGEAGIDPYTRAVSDVYQDLFGEGTFIGKGIYDVEAFEQAVKGRFPENRILSHDLIESAFARSGLITDVQLYEEFPSRYIADARRRHRWIRGDWQIAPWLLPRTPGPDNRKIENGLSGLSKWKIFDNLRRSLVPIALTFWLILGWMGNFGPPGLWTLFVLLIVTAPGLLAALASVGRPSSEIPWSMHLRGTRDELLRQMGFAVFTLVFLPYDALISLDAIGRTMARVWITHRHLLEWRTASDVERHDESNLASVLRAMWAAPAVALTLIVFLGCTRPLELYFAGVILSLWIFSPLIAWRISQPIRPRSPKLSEAQLVLLKRIARKTWRFFEVFVNDEENWLPPDNFQEYPAPVVAPRTSPTNMGLGLLSSLAACDFGYITPGQLLDRTGRALRAFDQMERYRGHFYNWYDTRTLKPLLPLYLSSVDSGNLAAHLLTFRQGLLELPNLPIANGVGLRGLEHTVIVLADTARASDAPDAVRQIRAIHEKLRATMAQPPASPAALAESLEKLTAMADELAPLAAQSQQQELIWWSQAFRTACRAQRRELELFTPWVSAPPAPELLLRASQQRARRLNEFSGMISVLQSFPTLREAARFEHTLLPLVGLAGDRLRSEKAGASELAWLDDLGRRVAEAGQQAAHRLRDVEMLAQRCGDCADMDFTFLFDKTRELFVIGFNASDHRMDSSYYDLLASEARLTSYLAISQNQVKQEHWFNLGRIVVSPDGKPVLVSWSGSMFEYLMPLLVMPTYENTLLDSTYRAVVERQIEYGRERNIPWGFSESGYNVTDAQLNYQYRAFGVPGLGLKRGLSEDLVVAPYAAVMALMVSPAAACANLERLARDGREGPYGFYEAIDYTPSRLQPGQKSAPIRSWMAHHQGMSMVSLAYALLDKPMQRRFNADPFFKSTELLLQERVPRNVAPLRPSEVEGAALPNGDETRKESLRVITNPNAPMPEAHLLSNGRYHVMVSASGGGYSRWRDLALTRWREDATRDCWGNFCYLRDLDSGEVWSAAHQPTQRVSRFYEAIFTQGRAEFRRRLDNLDVHTEISVSPEDDVELRRLTLTNHSKRARAIEITTYAEVALNSPGADLSHPAFSKLFVQTEIIADHHAVLCLRRPRSQKEKTPCFFHFVLVGDHDVGAISYETDRAKFLGRGQFAASPRALQESGPLSNSDGSPLDPIVAIRRTVKIAPDETVRFDAIFGVHETRDGVLALIQKYHDPGLTGRIIELAWTHSQVILHQLNITEADAQLFGRLAGALLYPTRFRRAPARILLKNNRSQANLWTYGISGDAPLVLVFLTDASRTDFARQAIQAHAYWRLKGLACDMVFLTEENSVYRAGLYEQVVGLVAGSAEASLLDRPGGIFIRRIDQIQEGDRILLQTVARVVLSDGEGTFAEQVGRAIRPEPVIPQLIPSHSEETQTIRGPLPPLPKPQFFNGYGGFTRDGREYVITLRPGQATPAPWVNVLANPRFGTVVSESGGAYTWADNAHEFRLTPWWNDPVSDTTGEALYLRDDHAGEVWSPTPGPMHSRQSFSIRHGFGYSVFSTIAHGIESELTVFVDAEAPVKFAWLKVRNVSRGVRKISATAYHEWVLGELREKTAMHVTTEIDGRSGALLARNPYNGDFSGRVAFADVQMPHRQFTCDRSEFLGRNGSAGAPDGLKRSLLSGRSGAGFDPCAALQVSLDLSPGQSGEVVFTLGAGRDFGEAQDLIQRFRGPEAALNSLDKVKAFWVHALGAVRVETPDPAVNVLANGWLAYQVISSRLWGRSGFYQSGGAYGFRDQLQDAMAVLHSEPLLLRAHLLRAAAHQFVEGDVQHWWHPPTDRGVRTHFSDDFLFLPYATCRYVLSLNDTGALDEMIPFLEDRPVKPEEEAYYDLPRRSGVSATLYEHCVRAINHGLSFGVHGLPLIGCGDWNDGMNQVGEHGKGESVWLAFFLYDVLTQFAQVARLKNDEAFAQRCLDNARDLRQNIEKNAWDGDWYRRAYFDDGTPLGSAQNDECQIDSLPQSWAVISGAADPERARRAMDAVNNRLVRRDAQLIQLFDPPFDKSSLNPGYIKGYLPGVRENGGQYTHAAVWTILAFAMLGDAARAWELLAMILPINHSLGLSSADRYRVEPYVVAADVYAVPPHTGRGGWTWYTGSAAWLYRLMIEHLIGLKLEIDCLRFTPCLPAAWKSATVHYRYRNSTYHITLRAQPAWGRVHKITLDGRPVDGLTVPLRDDQKEHLVEVIFQ